MNHILVKTKSGAEYIVYHDVIDASEDGYVYGYRTNGKPRCVFKRGSRNTVNDCRWFYLRNVTIVEDQE